MIQLNKQLLVIVMVGMGLILILMTRFGIIQNGKLQTPDIPFMGDHDAANEAVPSGANIAPSGGTPAQSAPVAKASGVKSGVAFAAPAEGDVWAFDISHAIVWNREAGEPGNIYLVNADTNTLVGWILPSATPKQVSYAWNTRDVAQGIIGGTAVTVKPGRYYLTYALEGDLADVKSGTFRIVAAGGAERVTRVVTLKNVSVTPAQLEVSRGTPVAFVNYDTTAHTFTVNGSAFGPFTVAANGGIYTLQTLGLQPDTYNYYSNVWTYRAPGTLIVK